MYRYSRLIRPYHYPIQISATAAEPAPVLIVPDLVAAVMSGDLPRVRQLLAQGAYVNAFDSNGDTPLHLAVRTNRVDIARLLLGAAAIVNDKNSQGFTPLQLAVSQSRYFDMSPMIRLLLEQPNIDVYLGPRVPFGPLLLPDFTRLATARAIEQNIETPQDDIRRGNPSLKEMYELFQRVSPERARTIAMAGSGHVQSQPADEAPIFFFPLSVRDLQQTTEGNCAFLAILISILCLGNAARLTEIMYDDGSNIYVKANLPGEPETPFRIYRMGRGRDSVEGMDPQIKLWAHLLARVLDNLGVLASQRFGPKAEVIGGACTYAPFVLRVLLPNVNIFRLSCPLEPTTIRWLIDHQREIIAGEMGFHTDLLPGHAYAVCGIEDRGIRLYNPHNPTVPIQLGWDEVNRISTHILIATLQPMRNIDPKQKFFIYKLINSVDEAGELEHALAVATYDQDRPQIEELIAQGANLNAQGQAGAPPLHLAILRDYIDVVRLLLQGGARTNTLDYIYGFTPLQYAAMLDRPEIIQLLLANGADINDLGRGNMTALHVAAAYKKSNAARVLLAHGGADLNAHDNAGETPLEVALARNSTDVARLIEANIAAPR